MCVERKCRRARGTFGQNFGQKTQWSEACVTWSVAGGPGPVFRGFSESMRPNESGGIVDQEAKWVGRPTGFKAQWLRCPSLVRRQARKSSVLGSLMSQVE